MNTLFNHIWSREWFLSIFNLSFIPLSTVFISLSRNEKGHSQITEKHIADACIIQIKKKSRKKSDNLEIKGFCWKNHSTLFLYFHPFIPSYRPFVTDTKLVVPQRIFREFGIEKWSWSGIVKRSLIRGGFLSQSSYISLIIRRFHQ